MAGEPQITRPNHSSVPIRPLADRLTPREGNLRPLTDRLTPREDNLRPAGRKLTDEIYELTD